MSLTFFKGKRIFITGHTGFKGSWLCRILLNAGADIYGYSLESNTTPDLYSLSNIKQHIKSTIEDIRDINKLTHAFNEAKPEIVIHMAAQPIVRESYNNPRYTFETNVMGTVNILECLRKSNYTKSFLNVTTDKVYNNNNWEWGYRETDALCGYDPYSNSKSCSELITYSYKHSFFTDKHISISTARSGNVIGGGDFAVDRVIPDCVRAAQKNEIIKVRNPLSTRPYQHVLDSLMAYLLIIESQYNDSKYSECYNVGPDESSCLTTGQLVSLFCEKWGEGQAWESTSVEGPHEANFLKLDCSRIRSILKWKPQWNIDKSVEKVVEWQKTFINNGDIVKVMDKQIQEFMLMEE